MKKKLPMIPVLIAACVFMSFAKPPLTPQQYFAQGVIQGNNAIIRDGVSRANDYTYQQSLILAQQNHNVDYYNGLVTGANSAWQKIQFAHPVTPVQTTHYTIASYTSTTTTVYFHYSDGSSWEMTYTTYGTTYIP